MSRKSTRMGNMRWIARDHYARRRKKRKAEKLSRRKNRKKK